MVEGGQHKPRCLRAEVLQRGQWCGRRRRRVNCYQYLIRDPNLTLSRKHDHTSRRAHPIGCPPCTWYFVIMVLWTEIHWPLLKALDVAPFPRLLEVPIVYHAACQYSPATYASVTVSPDLVTFQDPVFLTVLCFRIYYANSCINPDGSNFPSRVPVSPLILSPSQRSTPALFSRPF